MGFSTILFADADREAYQSLIDELKKHSIQVQFADNGETAAQMVAGGSIDIVIADLDLPKVDGISLLQTIKETAPDTEVYIVTEVESVDTAVQALRLGAADYLKKPIDYQMFIQNIADLAQIQSVTGPDQKHSVSQRPHFDGIIGQSDCMQEVFGMVEKVADSDSTVLITGESGTGKELIARALHYASHRRSKRLVPVNCGAIPEELLESELFGHEKGAFTGAHRSRTGRFEVADGGTIFLDEIGDMSPNLQVKILRVLQLHEFERVGGVQSIKVDIRVIAATHRVLEQQVADGKFREDLYYRLNVIPVSIPPLRARRGDIDLLVDYFTDLFNVSKNRSVSGITSEAMEWFRRYRWPGNVRELQNMMERLIILKGSGTIGLEDLPDKLLRDTEGQEVPSISLPEDGVSFNTMVTNFEKQLIQQALKKTSGVKNKAAQLLNMNRTTLVEKMKKMQIKYNQ